MNRVQRRVHARSFALLTPLLAALFLYALLTRQRATEHLTPAASPTQEKSP